MELKDKRLFRQQCYIDGAWADAASRETIEVNNPSDDTIIGTMPKMSRDETAGAIDNEAAEKNPATAHLFIVNPLHGRARNKLFSTHPDTASRVARLRQQAVDMGQSPRPWG